MAEIKAFNKWGVEGVKVEDPGLEPFITLQPRIVPKTGARYAGSKFHKSKIFIVERLINKLMVPGHKSKKHFKTSGHITGKAQTAYHIVEEAFKQIESTTKENPIKVFVKALENAAQREEIITIEYGGARYPKAVEYRRFESVRTPESSPDDDTFTLPIGCGAIWRLAINDIEANMDLPKDGFELIFDKGTTFLDLDTQRSPTVGESPEDGVRAIIPLGKLGGGRVLFVLLNVVLGIVVVTCMGVRYYLKRRREKRSSVRRLIAK